MDETNETGAVPPVTPVEGSTGGADAPDEEPTGRPEPTERLEAVDRPQPIGPMPLSMPAFFSEQRVASPSGAPLEGADPSGPQPAPPSFGASWIPPGESSPTLARERPRRRGAVIVAVAALLAGGLGAGLGASLSGSGGSAPAGSAVSAPLRNAGSVAQIAAAVRPAIVDIRTKVASPEGEPTGLAAGTGMILTASGEVLTNNHVIADATQISVTLPTSGRSYRATVLGDDPTKDVALIQLQGAANLPTVALGDSSKVAVGDSVVAIGNAFGLRGPLSVVNGIVSAIGRTISASDNVTGAVPETLHGVIQTSAPISPGDSGGPLVNNRGQVIAINTAASASDGTGATVGFSIPINEALGIVRQIADGRGGNGVTIGLSPFLGITSAASLGGNGFGSVGPSSSVSGVSIGSVIASSPAANAGLQGGDVIVSIDGHATPTWSALTAAVGSHRPGDALTVTFVTSSNARQTVSVHLTGIPR